MIGVNIPQPAFSQIGGVALSPERILASLIEHAPDQTLRLHISNVCDKEGRVLVGFDSKTFSYVLTFIEEAEVVE